MARSLECGWTAIVTLSGVRIDARQSNRCSPFAIYFNVGTHREARREGGGGVKWSALLRAPRPPSDTGTAPPSSTRLDTPCGLSKDPLRGVTRPHQPPLASLAP
ncbi:unnamed protein product [Hapterophycus canaliculatus]